MKKLITTLTRNRRNLLGKAIFRALIAAGALAFANAQAQDTSDRLLGLVEPIQATKPLTLGITVVHLMDNFYTGIAYGIIDEAKRSGVEVAQVSVAGAYGNVKEQFAQLQAFKSLGVDYAVLSPAAYSGFDPVINDLAKSGIKTISAGIPVNSAKVTFGVLQDDFQIGRSLGKALCDDGAKGKKVIVVPGSAGLEWSRLRYEGFKEVATECGADLGDPAFKGDMTLADGLSQTQDLLMRTPDAQYVFTPVSYLGMGAAQAVRQSGRKVKVLTSTMVKEEETMIKDGRMLAVASEPGIIMGRLIVQYAIREHEGLPMPPLAKPNDSVPYPHFNVPTVLITKDNVETHPYNFYEYPPKDWKVSGN
ncbi:substrate-binding domain-containing protein [Pusillimonas noertemannii]|uniref:Monosaccharide ABC transporter substrate-binding protein (CUT2 family) n=1 Tax=Pusillimonas noertemannii TaxID=305977 RepID=A0A2U1CMS0_9BURK|nr:substrate-binding domain-containing protein [Pusillimonas noertemannii]NYT68671.1 substrate-binding domain-containing protein [Pusillimonas noertemannii]PVY62311.1 monosaccharide ABC transporter substrate-binding protein (CUT2 family) [Pusillimonas noertemannii]TFL10714.1 sugar ABC transporter substrate-binding protein [Pusillimonas noertemannii]